MTDREELLKRVDTDLGRGGGRPRIRGTRIDVSIVLDALAEGLSAEQIVDEYPALSVKDVRAAITYASELARDEVITIPPP